MEFANSFLLWTALGALLPIIIHLLNREKPKKVLIPTVSFIIKAVEKSSGSRKLNNVLLLIVRVLILLLITALIARPTIEAFSSTAQTSNGKVVIIVDNSYYTTHEKSSVNQLRDIKAKGSAIIDELPEGTQVCILSVDDDGGFTSIKDYAKEKIETLSPANQNIDIHNMVDAAIDLLSDSKEQGQIYILSDMNVGAWQGRYKLKESKHTIHVLKVPPRQGNIFISQVKLKSDGEELTTQIHARRRLTFDADIFGDRNLSGLIVSLKVNNEVIDEKTILDEGHSQNIKFSTSFDEPGTYFCEISIETDDSISDDNVYYLTLHVTEAEKIYIVNNAGLTSAILKAALAPSGWHGRQKYNIKQVLYSELKENLLADKPAAILLTDRMSFTEEQWIQLRSYTDNGGRLLFYPNETSNLTKLNQGLFPYFQNKAIEVTKEMKVQINRTKPSKVSSASIEQLLSDVFISKFFTFNETLQTSENDILFRYADGSPCLVQKNTGKGSVMFFGLCPHNDYSTFLSSSSFALIWHKIAEFLVLSERPEQNFFCGETVEILAKKHEISNYKVKSPTGTVDQIDTDAFSGEDLLSTSYSLTPIPGHYRCSSSLFGGFSCNMERTPEYYQYPPEKSYAPLLVSKNKNLLKATGDSLFNPDGLLRILIITLLLLFGFEVFLGNRSYHANS